MHSPQPTLHVIAVAHQRYGELRVFVQSWLNQSESNWKLTVLHDGPDARFDAIMAEYQAQAPQQIEARCTDTRHNDYGHSLRDMGLQNIQGDYVLLTNADNYFIPKAMHFLNQALAETQSQADVLMFDMVHSHHRPGGREQPAYCAFQVDFHPGAIDVSAAIVRRELAAQAGFRDKTHDGDATYFEDIKAIRPLQVYRIPRILFVHN